MAAPDFALPEQIAERYFLRQLVGRGGFAQVAAAFDVQQGRPCAVKMVQSEGPGATRFVVEAEAMARVRHPNVVPIWDFGSEEGIDYMVMPLFQSTLLTMVLRAGPLPVAPAKHIVGEVARGVAALHANGIVHRDLKPSNVLLDDGQPIVADLGIAQVPGGSGTTSGVVLGSQRWRAPEQSVDAKRAGPSADIYALGLVLMFTVTGIRGVGDPRQRAALLYDVPDEIRGVVETATATEPADRYPSVDAFLAAIG